MHMIMLFENAWNLVVTLHWNDYKIEIWLENKIEDCWRLEIQHLIYIFTIFGSITCTSSRK